MAHEWRKTDSDHRKCLICGRSQSIRRRRDTFGRLKYFWRPLVGRCPDNHQSGPDAINQNAILGVLKDGPLHRDEIARRTGLSVKSVASTLTILRRKNKADWHKVNGKRKIGWWELCISG